MKIKKIITITIFATILAIIPISIVFAQSNIDTSSKLTESNYEISDIKTKSNIYDTVIEIMDSQISTKYSYSINDIDVYTDTLKNEYLQKNGKTIGFIKKMNTESQIKAKKINTSITESEAKNIVYAYCDSNVFEFDKYTFLEITYNSTYNEYQVYFNKKISNYLTMDIIYVTVDIEGNITSFLASKQGMFDKYQSININEKKLNESIQEFLNNKYMDNLKDYVVKDKTLKIKNSKLVLEYIIEINLNNNTFLEALDYYIE